MIVTLWGTRGSLPSPGPDTVRYGGNTACISIENSQGNFLVVDAGTGIRVLGQNYQSNSDQLHILLTHLHMDHVQGLPFFHPIYQPGLEIHIWGPGGTDLSLESRLLRYLSPPLFPVRTRDLFSRFFYHELVSETFEIQEYRIRTQFVIHPNLTLGYRIECDGNSLAYLPDHEPALGVDLHSIEEEWISGYALADGADLLIHDSQYTGKEYQDHLGFGHSSIDDAFRFAQRCNVKRLVTFHHDPEHNDDQIDQMTEDAIKKISPNFQVFTGNEGLKVILKQA